MGVFEKTQAANSEGEPVKQATATLATDGINEGIAVARIATVAVAIPLQAFPTIQSIAAALDRQPEYLTAPDDRLPGLCLLAGDDIEDIQAGRLPIEAARLYLSNTERDHPHLAERREPVWLDAVTEAERTPIDAGIERLKKQGLEIVPEDARLIRQRLGCRMDWPGRLDDYRLVWLEAMDGQLPHQKQNRGRFAANTWLREVME